ncbi:N-acetyltransferase [Pseudoxanthomonas gei]|uniref:N-acetyltransferase n=2 Tax=Pseudoxanthomonas gei TaxID=1383030 RepID=A0ABX0AEH2_9GAMM|nr:N-acetyltransferase [Pseudoxanthomonas gei]
MSQVAESEMFELILIDLPNLRRLEASEPVDLGGMQTVDGALPPARVATHALAQIDVGTPARWCAPFLIVSRNAVLGTCRFRAAPADGRVEIGYGVAGSQRGRGVATEAVRQLLEIATSSGLVKEVVARIVPENAASSKVVSRLGFSKGDLLVDHDGQTLAQWSLRIAT